MTPKGLLQPEVLYRFPHPLLFAVRSSSLDENDSVEIQGRVHNGVVVPERELSLPEGTLVTVVYPASPGIKPPDSGRRVRLPLVQSDRPGSRELDEDRVAEILDDDDVPS